MNNGGGGVPFQGFKRDLKEWAGMASIIHKPTGLFLWGANSNSENDDIGAEGVFTGKGPPVMHAWDIAGGISREFVWNGVGPGSLGATTIWGGYTQDQDGLGGFTQTTVSSSVSGTASSYSVWDGEVSAGAFPGIPFETEITCSETTKWYLAVDQAIDFGSHEPLHRLSAHRAGDQTGDAGSGLLSDRQTQERSDHAR